MIIITWNQFVERCGEHRPSRSKDGRFTLSETLSCTCLRCNASFEVKAKHLWLGITRSCGCLHSDVAGRPSRKTFGEARMAIAKFNITLISDAPDDQRLIDVKVVGGHRFKCGCGEIFGEKCTIQAVMSGNTTSCGCAHRQAMIKVGANRNGAYTPAQWAASKARHAIYVEGINASLATIGSSLVSEFDVEKVRNLEPVKCRCRCGREFVARAVDISRGFTRSCGCIKSGLELELLDFVRILAPEAIHNTRKVIAPLELDIYVPDRLGIELNGLWWHGETVKKEMARISCLRKVEAMRKLRIPLLIFFEDEWRERRNACEGYVRALLGAKGKVGARECSIENGGEEFIAAYHIQGAVRNAITIQLRLAGQTVAAASFAKATAQAGGAGVYELTRYCVGPVTSVSGGLGRCLAAFIARMPDVSQVITYSDWRLSSGRIYEATGFVKVHDVAPRYWYTLKDKRFHRFNFRKDELIRRGWLRDGETEAECMRRHKFDRVWDAGKTKWSFIAK